MSHSPLYTWVEPKDDPSWTKTIISEFNIHPVAAQVLTSRGFDTLEAIHSYLYAQLPDLFDPALFPDMDKAVKRLLQALHHKETILIYGDNDVDGMTGSALLIEFIEFIGGKALSYIHSRSEETNKIVTGTLMKAIDFATEQKASLIITVDCGISSLEELAAASSRNIDIIVTDHHEPTTKLPHCIATLNPKLIGTTYPNHELTGVGVAFKLAHGITDALAMRSEIPTKKIDLKKYLDLVALGTLADMGSLLGENRILVRYGLKQLKKGKRQGLAKLSSLCDVQLSEITPMDIASKIAPRLNSLGRIADPNKGVELLLVKEAAKAEKLAQELNLNNHERQKIERKNTEDIEKEIEKHPEILREKVIILSSSEWHPGIIPILATRIAKQYNKPTLIIALEGDIGKGSMRTIPEFPLLPILKETEHLLTDFGGHAYAAGFTLQTKNLEAFKALFLSLASKELSSSDLKPKLYLDAKVSFADLTFDFMEALSLLEPFGNGNPAPLFTCEAVQTRPPKIIGKNHLKFYLQEGDRFLEGVGFGLAPRRGELLKRRSPLRFVFTSQVNTFRGKTAIQLQIKDFSP